jgi:hypothetical protein
MLKMPSEVTSIDHSLVLKERADRTIRVPVVFSSLVSQFKDGKKIQHFWHLVILHGNICGERSQMSDKSPRRRREGFLPSDNQKLPQTKAPILINFLVHSKWA